jgi:peptidoglycan/xylan/chitin deacetylase (PgdA/CDA1 family)
LRPASLPLTLEVAIRGQTHRWSFEPGSDPATPAWRADLEDPSTNRQRAFLELWSLLVELEEAERGRALATLREWSGIESGVDPDRLPLSRDELVEMSRHPLVEIGCHTASHARLPRRASATQIEEIGSCKRALEAWTGRTPRSFSYPYGAHDRSAQAAVRQLDFRLACTSRSEPVAPVESRFTLPRLQVVDQDGDAFAEWLREWFPRWLNS